jgi:hypothetical protein
MKCHRFKVGSVLFRFELQQVLLALVYIKVPVLSVVTGVCIQQECVTIFHFTNL